MSEWLSMPFAIDSVVVEKISSKTSEALEDRVVDEGSAVARIGGNVVISCDVM